MTAAVGLAVSDAPANYDDNKDGVISYDEFIGHYEGNSTGTISQSDFNALVNNANGLTPGQLNACLDAGMSPAQIDQCLDAGMTPSYVATNASSLSVCMDKGMTAADIKNCELKGMSLGQMQTCLANGLSGSAIVNCLNAGISVGDVAANAKAIHDCMSKGMTPADLKACLDQGLTYNDMFACIEGEVAPNQIAQTYQNLKAQGLNNTTITAYLHAGVDPADVAAAYKLEQNLVTEYGCNPSDARTFVTSEMGNESGGGKTVSQVEAGLTSIPKDQVREKVSVYAGGINSGFTPGESLATVQSDAYTDKIAGFYEAMYGNDNELISAAGNGHND